MQNEPDANQFLIEATVILREIAEHFEKDHGAKCAHPLLAAFWGDFVRYAHHLGMIDHETFERYVEYVALEASFQAPSAE